MPGWAPVASPSRDREAIPCDGPGAIRTFVPPGSWVWGTGRLEPCTARPRRCGPDAVDSCRTSRSRSPANISRSCPTMRTIRLLAAGLTILAVSACATATPGWTYAPASASAAPSADASASAGPSGSVAPSAAPSASAPAAPVAPRAAPAPSAPSAPAGRCRGRALCPEHRVLPDRAQRAGGHGLPDQLREQRPERSHTTSRSRIQPGSRSSTATSSTASRPGATTSSHSRPAPTSSSARSIRTWSGR